MSITRRNALLGATAAAAVTGLTVAPLAMKAAGVKVALAGDPVIGLVQQLNAAWTAWMTADDAFEDACHRAGFNTFEYSTKCRDSGIKELRQERERWKARFWDLEPRVLDTPATTLHGVIAKLRDFYHDDEIALMRAGDLPADDLEKKWAASIYRDLEHLAGEARS